MAESDLKLVVFDMDGTLLTPRSSWAVLHETFGTNNDRNLAAYMSRKIDDEQFIRSDVALWRKAIGPVAVERVNRILDAIAPAPGAIETVAALHEAGLATAIISGGLKHLARRLAKEWEMAEYHANDLRVDDDGLLTGEGWVEVPAREKGHVLRRMLVRHGLTREEVATVGDGVVDVEMFGLSGISIAVNTQDPAVYTHATHHLRVRDLRGMLRWLLPKEESEKEKEKAKEKAKQKKEKSKPDDRKGRLKPSSGPVVQ